MLNLEGCFYIVAGAGSGGIVNLTSAAGQASMADAVGYGAAKAVLNNLTRTRLPNGRHSVRVIPLGQRECRAEGTDRLMVRPVPAVLPFRVAEPGR
ncbi:NADP-dependent 3-hydroxy acid dehydrogenase YdfG [Sphingobium sp. OAS761]|nr:NADP-dependent 3-hydroxy acid dehydrogenase YdfG [Sphingobium sp. OAS761]